MVSMLLAINANKSPETDEIGLTKQIHN